MGTTFVRVESADHIVQFVDDTENSVEDNGLLALAKALVGQKLGGLDRRYRGVFQLHIDHDGAIDVSICTPGR
jgi:hypothetical protein